MKNRIESLKEEYKYFEMIGYYYDFNSNIEKLRERYDYDYGYVFHMLNEKIGKSIDDSLKEEETELIYGTPFSPKDVKKDEKRRSYVISDDSNRRDRKFYLKHYPTKRLLEKHDFTPEEKHLRAEIFHAKNVLYKDFFFIMKKKEMREKKGKVKMVVLLDMNLK